jgi:hypothetical protein
MYNYSEFGLLLLLVVAFSAPIVTNMVQNRWGNTDDEEENS